MIVVVVVLACFVGGATRNYHTAQSLTLLVLLLLGWLGSPSTHRVGKNDQTATTNFGCLFNPRTRARAGCFATLGTHCLTRTTTTWIWATCIEEASFALTHSPPPDGGCCHLSGVFGFRNRNPAIESNTRNRFEGTRSTIDDEGHVSSQQGRLKQREEECTRRAMMTIERSKEAIVVVVIQQARQGNRASMNKLIACCCFLKWIFLHSSYEVLQQLGISSL